MNNEVEKDMQIFPVVKTTRTLSVRDFINKVSLRNPLLGMVSLSPHRRIAIENFAKRSIKYALDGNGLDGFCHMSILLIIVHYAKNWDYAESRGFWAYICEQLGYKFSTSLYSVLTESVKAACVIYGRFFLRGANRENNYYATVLAHAIAPKKSFFALCNFLAQFYQNNLDYSVSVDDPAINRMIRVLRSRCNDETIEQDESIRGNVSGIQIGFRELLAQRPHYMRHFLTKLLQRIDQTYCADIWLPENYADELLMQWYTDRITKSDVGRKASAHKRTTAIAFSYSRIRIAYVLDEDGEPAIRIPSIRLSDKNDLVIVVYSGNYDIYRQRAEAYGNDYACTSEETIIPLADISDVDFSVLRIDLFLDGQAEQIYSSKQGLRRKTLLFHDGKEMNNKVVDDGNYLLFAPKGANVTFRGDVKRQRRSFFAQLYDVYLSEESSVYVNDALVFCSRPPLDSLRFRLPQPSARIEVSENSYPIYPRDKLSLFAAGSMKGSSFLARTQNGDLLTVTGEEDGVYSIETPGKNGFYTISLYERGTGRVLDEAVVYIVNSLEVTFDKPYYLENSEGTLSGSLDEKKLEVPLSDVKRIVRIPYGIGYIVVQVPYITLTLDGQAIPKNTIWKGAILPSSRIKINCGPFIDASLFLGQQIIERSDVPGGFEYTIGNLVQFVENTQNELPVQLFINGEKKTLFTVIFNPCILAMPQFILKGEFLVWMNPSVFVGDPESKLLFEFHSKRTGFISMSVEQGKHILSTAFPQQSEKYKYKIFSIKDTVFGVNRTKLYQGSVIVGNRAKVIFRDETLCIAGFTKDGRSMKMIPFFVEKIDFIGNEALGYTDLSGEYPHYKGKMYFIHNNAKRYFSEFNPVDIYLVNEESHRLYITFDQGEGLFIDMRPECRPRLYINRDPPKRLQKWFDFPDYFEYFIPRSCIDVKSNCTFKGN